MSHSHQILIVNPSNPKHAARCIYYICISLMTSCLLGLTNFFSKKKRVSLTNSTNHGCIPIPNPRHCEDVDGRVDLQLWQANKGSFGTREATCSCLPGYWPDASMHQTSSLFTRLSERKRACTHARAGRGQGKCVQGNFNKGLVFISSMHMHAHMFSSAATCMHTYAISISNMQGKKHAAFAHFFKKKSICTFLSF